MNEEFKKNNSMVLIFIMFFSFFSPMTLFAEENNIETLLEQIVETKDVESKSILLEKLKIELTLINKNDREQTAAILKAKKKIPISKYKNE